MGGRGKKGERVIFIYLHLKKETCNVQPLATSLFWFFEKYFACPDVLSGPHSTVTLLLMIHGQMAHDPLSSIQIV